MKTFSLALALFATLANSNKLPTEGTIDSAKAINLAQTEVETDSRAYANVYARDNRYNPYGRAAQMPVNPQAMGAASRQRAGRYPQAGYGNQGAYGPTRRYPQPPTNQGVPPRVPQQARAQRQPQAATAAARALLQQDRYNQARYPGAPQQSLYGRGIQQQPVYPQQRGYATGYGPSHGQALQHLQNKGYDWRNQLAQHGFGGQVVPQGYGPVGGVPQAVPQAAPMPQAAAVPQQQATVAPVTTPKAVVAPTPVAPVAAVDPFKPTAIYAPGQGERYDYQKSVSQPQLSDQVTEQVTRNIVDAAMSQMQDKHDEAQCALDGDCDTEPTASEVIKVCNSDAGLCEDVPIHLAPLHDQSCQLQVIDSVSHDDNESHTGIAVVCDLTPGSPEVLPALEAEDAAHAECDGSCEIADLTPVVRAPPHVCTIDKDGKPVCDFDANLVKAGEMEGDNHEDGHICPLCGSKSCYQTLYWELEKYKELLEQAKAANKAAETVSAVAAKSDVPTMKEITICRTDTGRCQRKSIRADIDIKSDLPDHCEIKEVPLTDEYGQSVTQEVLVCGPEDIPILEKELGLTDLLVPEPVPEFKEVVVCSTLTGTCEMVEVAGDHEVLEGCDVTTVPITTSEGVKMEEAIIVDTPEEAAHYGFSTPDPSKVEEPAMPEPVLPEIPEMPEPVVAEEPIAPVVDDDLIPVPTADIAPESAPVM